VKLARVVATVVSTVNAADFDGRTLLVCDLLDPDGMPSGGYLIAVDSVGAGAGETVLLLDEGNSARQVLSAPGAPIRTVVVGIVDAVTGEQAKPGAVPGPVAAEGAAEAPAATEAPVTATPRPKARRPRSRRKDVSA
jgi:ethanolamine utilization protein EutN